MRAPGSPWLRWLIPLAVGLHLVSALGHVWFGGMNSDEGFYAVAARAVWQGELPYRDFGYPQLPLLPYVNGLAMQLTGFGLFEQRAVNGLWGALTLGLLALWLALRTRPAWALGFVLLSSLSAPWMYFIHLGKTYAFVGLVAVAALWVYTEWQPGERKVVTLALLGTIGIGCRLPMAPFFAALWAASLLELPRPAGRTWLGAIAMSLVWPVLLLGPFYLAAPEATRFWVFDLHRLSLPTKHWHLAWRDVVALAPALWLGLVAVVAYHAFTRRVPARKDLAVFIAVVLALAANILPQGVFEEYSVPLLPLLAAVVASGLWRMGETIGWLRHPALPAGLVPGNIAVAVALLWTAIPADRRGTWSVFLPLNAPAYNAALPASLARARTVVENYLAPDQPFVGPQIILAAETGRQVPRHLRMGAFTATADFPAAVARRLNLATFEDLDAYFADPHVPLIAFAKSPGLNYSWSMPSFRNPPERNGTHWGERFRRDFVLAYEDADFLLLARRTAVPAVR